MAHLAMWLGGIVPEWDDPMLRLNLNQPQKGVDKGNDGPKILRADLHQLQQGYNNACQANYSVNFANGTARKSLFVYKGCGITHASRNRSIMNPQGIRLCCTMNPQGIRLMPHNSLREHKYHESSRQRADVASRTQSIAQKEKTERAELLP